MDTSFVPLVTSVSAELYDPEPALAKDAAWRTRTAWAEREFRVQEGVRCYGRPGVVAPMEENTLLP